MNDPDLLARLRALECPLGPVARSLRIADRHVRIEGLDTSLARELDERWGGFVDASTIVEPGLTVEVRASAGTGWFQYTGDGEQYRMEVRNDAANRVVVSYNFAIFRAEGGAWRVAVHRQPQEPLHRILDNAMRYFAARLALEAGGFALHASGVLRDGRAYMFAGPSRAGKTTAVGLCAPAQTLGDDMGLVLPGPVGWLAPALPFDNSERVDRTPPEGLFPLAGIWRLRQSEQARVERPPRRTATATLMGCAAFPWALPELADELLESVRRAVADGLFAELHFRKDRGFWSLLV